MRRFHDEAGRVWDVVAGRESWGGIVALFVPREGDARPRSAPIPARGYAEATTWLDASSDAELRERFSRATEVPL
ncbi:MAG: hypothetical protein RQ745_13865 [Longimicrobiales bacterium]|nr:hypothetical protein [Longimicrobiales bacterium]